MGLFEKIFGKSTKVSEPRYPIYQTLTGYQPSFTSTSGAVYEDALIRATIHAAAKHCSKLHVEFNGRGAAGLAVRLSRPNPFQTWGQFLYRARTVYDVDNTCIIAPSFDKYGRVNALYTVLPSECTIVGKTENPMIALRFPTGGFVQVPVWEVGIMTKFQHKNDFFGSDNKALYQTMQLIDIQNQGIAEAVKSAATYRFMAVLNNFSDPEDVREKQREFDRQNFSGNGGGLLLFPNLFANPQQIKSDHFVIDDKQMGVIKDNVFDYFGSNEKILQNKCYGDEWNAYYEGEIEPWSIQFSDVITDLLRLTGDLTGDCSVMATANRLQYMSTADKLNFTIQNLDRGVINRDTAREVWNLPPLPNGLGQTYIIRGEYVNADGPNGTINNPNAQPKTKKEETPNE